MARGANEVPANGLAVDQDGRIVVDGGYNATPPTLTDGFVAPLQLDSRGSLRTVLSSVNSATPLTLAANSMSDQISNVTSLDVLAFAMAYNGVSWDRARTPSVFKVVNVTIVAGTPQTIWTPGAGKKFRLMGYSLAASVSAVVILKDSATEIVRAGSQSQLGTPSGSMGNGILSAAANNALNLDASVGATISGLVFGTEE